MKNFETLSYDQKKAPLSSHDVMAYHSTVRMVQEKVDFLLLQSSPRSGGNLPAWIIKAAHCTFSNALYELKKAWKDGNGYPLDIRQAIFECQEKIEGDKWYL